jgi:hypothetical protein
MALLGMSDKEFEYRQKSIAEAVKLIGQDAYLFPVDSVTEDLYSDKDIVYEGARKIGILFESNPKPILKKFQWLTEDEELPYVAYLVPLDHKNIKFTVTDQMLIRIDSTRVLESERVFLVTNVRGVELDPLMWMCKLVPFRPKVDMNPKTGEYEPTVAPKTDTGYSYLKRSDSL